MLKFKTLKSQTGFGVGIFLVAILLSSCSVQQSSKISIIDAKTAVNVDDKYMPVGATNVFTPDTSRVYCWFSWSRAEKETKVVAKWHYLTDDIPVLEYTFAIPRREGSGSVSLSMPDGKVLPAGMYRVTLEVDKKQLKALTFKVS